MFKKLSIFLAAILMIFVVISACSRPASDLPFATATGSGDSPFPAGTVSIESIQALATHTAQAATLMAAGVGGGTTPTAGTPDGTLGTTTPTLDIPTLTPTLGTSVPTITTPTPGRPAQYTIMPGEYPFCIARRFDVDPNELLALNPQVIGIPENQIPSGLVLTIPQTGNPFPGDRSWHDHPTTYTVPEAMTVYKVACYFGDIDPSVIILANNLTPPYNVYTGQTLTIP